MPSVPFSRTLHRRALLGSIGALLSGSVSLRARADAPTAPVNVQAQILARILPFERGFQGRAGASVVVLIVRRRTDPDSSSTALQMMKALSDIGAIADKPLTPTVIDYASASALGTECKARRAMVLYLTPNLSSEIGGIASALVGSAILSVAAVESDVARGAVLGIEVSAGKPRMSINLAQARAQKLDFPSQLLKLARIR